MGPDSDNFLKIKRKVYEGVTETPHFPMQISYAGCHVEYEDIYFDDLENVAIQLEALDATRKGELILDGGSRIQIRLSCRASGALAIAFRAQAARPAFPGQLDLKGCYEVDSEYSTQTILRLRKLITVGEAFVLKGRNPARSLPADEEPD